MFKFFKLSTLWLVAILSTLLLTTGFAWLGIDWMAKIAIASLVGYVYLLGTSFFFSGFGDVPISTVAWWTAILHVVLCSSIDGDPIFLIGPTIGVAICYWLMRRSEKILDSRPAADLIRI